MIRLTFLLTLLFATVFPKAQHTLSLEEYLRLVKSYHPVAKHAALDMERAKAGVTSARGGFDPLFQNNISRKEFGGLLYYDHQLTEVKIPTWYGVDVTAGVESLSGFRTSAEETRGNSSYFGLSIPVGKGLLLDKRRADLQQAKAFQQLSAQEQRAVINDLLYDATKAYWTWWEKNQTQLLFQQAKQNAAQRFRLVKTAQALGERPAIDTIEALAQWQSLQVRETEILLKLSNAQLEAGVFLWQQNGQPYVLPASVVPQQPATAPLDVAQLDALLQRLPIHPTLQQYRFKLAAMDVEKRLKFQSLLPTVYVKYNQLNKSHDLSKSFNSPWLQNNYRLGLAVSVPLRFSEGRGEYREAKLKIEQLKLEQQNKQTLLQTKLRQAYNEWKAVREQIALQQNAVRSYAALQRGEEIKFSNGESSLFLVNARELKTLEGQQKLIDLQSKEQKALAATLWAAGALADR